MERMFDGPITLGSYSKEPPIENTGFIFANTWQTLRIDDWSFMPKECWNPKGSPSYVPKWHIEQGYKNQIKEMWKD